MSMFWTDEFPSRAWMDFLHVAWIPTGIFFQNSKFRDLAWKNFPKLYCNMKNLLKNSKQYAKCSHKIPCIIETLYKIPTLNIENTDQL